MSMTSADIRRQFLDFFVQKHGHTFVPSSPVVPLDDPTLLFTNAGMNQFKPIFLGTQPPAARRVANTQKCIRAGGKHNDLDDVGRSRRHHTFFEMLGNWSFGDYFKREAITWAWELLTQVWNLDSSRLHATVFEGDEANGVPRDTEAADLWKQIAGMPDDHIHFLGKDNFWEMGETGPCGPCTEILIDRTSDKSGGRLVNTEDPRVMEIWNLVFIQYNRNPDRGLTPLPARHVDTGMGFERICQVLQDRDSTYAIDLFVPYFQALTELTGIKYTGTFPKTNVADPVAEAASPQLRHDIAFRVIADHIRTLTFALTDGAEPSNEGRGYVLRRILRRAARFGRQTLGLREPFMHGLVDVVVETMGSAFPELTNHPRRVKELIHQEEVSFGRTLDAGIGHWFAAAAAAIRTKYAEQRPGKSEVLYVLAEGGVRADLFHYAGLNFDLGRARIYVPELGDARPLPMLKDISPMVFAELGIQNIAIAGEHAFKLHDTYGFPIDLTQIMAAERGMSVDIAGYEKLMEEARERARAGGKGGDSPVYDLPPVILAELPKQGIGPTHDQAKYQLEPISARVMAIWNGTNLDPSADTSEDQEVALILDRTNFYAEAGGQVGDSGELRASTGQFDVQTTRAVGGYILHIGRVRSGTIRVGDAVTAVVSEARRPTMQNHTGTHLLNWALREVLGDGVQQKGSLVAPDRLRFDFSHPKAMSDEEVIRVEDLVNESIAREMRVYAEIVPQEQALRITGLRAVFGEKYPPHVRVVSIGKPVADLLKDPANAEWRQYSIEFCGGTHLGNSSEVESLVITTEESVSKGVRRLVALTGPSAKAAVTESQQLEQSIDRIKSLPQAQIPQALNALQKQLGSESLPLRAKRRGQAVIAELQARHKAWEKSQKTASSQLDVASLAADLLGSAEIHGSGKIVVADVPGASDEQLRAIVDSIKRRSASFAALLASAGDSKVTLVAAVSDDLIARGVKAGDWVREAAKITGGGGGGRPQMAQAGGKDPSKLSEALDVARQYARQRID